MPEMRGMIALVLAILLGFLAGCPAIDPAEEIINKIHTEFNKADIELAIAWDAINRGDYEIAKTKTYNTRSYIETAFKYYRTIEDKLTEADRTHWLTHFELYRINVDLTLIDIDWWIAYDELTRLLDGDINERLITTFELHIRRTEELSDRWHNYANKLEFIQRTQPDFGITDTEISDAREFASISEEVAKEDHISLNELKAAMPDYIPIDDRVLPIVVDIPPIPENIIPLDLATFFNEFDRDGNGELDIGEAQDFFYWVEDNIVYRWDGEEDYLLPDFFPGYPVGDGRPDGQYSQTPYETWSEGMGDCEDMAILQVAFFNHFGISAYMATVATRPNGVMDHAIAVVYIAESVEEFADLLGGIVYYDLNGRYYMLVDNAYSDAFGDLSLGLERGAFYMKPWRDGQFLFTLEEMYEMDRHIREGW
jgi:hypothetical protein